MRKQALGFVAIGLVAGLIAFGVELNARHGIEVLKSEYREKSAGEALRGAQSMDRAFQLIYQNLRTLASLPGIRGIDRHASTLSPEAHTTFQMIYNNLASSVAVSDVYVVPGNFDPDRHDPQTGRGEEPIIMFDELVLNAGSGLTADERARNPESVVKLENSGPPEIEDFEYMQLRSQAAWFAQHFPDDRKIEGLRVPMLSSNEVITCDNTQYISSRNDADRKGMIFSVPFFDHNGKYDGMVSAIILSNALRNLLPNSNYVLINTGGGYVNAAADAGPHVQAALPGLARGDTSTNLLFSQAIPISISDPRSPWLLWVGYDDNRFYGSPEYRALIDMRFNGLLLAFIMLVAGSLSWFFINRDLSNSRNAAAALAKARDEARQAEAEALTLANDIGRLNGELTEKMELLQEAQEEALRKGKMAQLGQLTATIAHELRNPMGTIRTTAFLIRRKVKGAGLDIDQHLSRIDSGIGRCDGIISQLLDFARTKKPELTPVDIDKWLAEMIEEEAQSLPEAIGIECRLGLQGLTVKIDPARMHRVLINLLSNAAEAMVGKAGMPAPVQLKSPSIKVETRQSARGIEIAVTDNGPGMPPEVLAKVCEPLFTTKNFGTGLGIPAIERILELHGGGLEITSEPGRGATFVAWFPAGDPVAKAA